jgi:hypothetical protein
VHRLFVDNNVDIVAEIHWIGETPMRHDVERVAASLVHPCQFAFKAGAIEFLPVPVPHMAMPLVRRYAALLPDV